MQATARKWWICRLRGPGYLGRSVEHPPRCLRPPTPDRSQNTVDDERAQATGADTLDPTLRAPAAPAAACWRPLTRLGENQSTGVSITNRGLAKGRLQKRLRS